MTLEEFTRAHGLPDSLQLDGTIKRFNLFGKNDGWFVGKELQSGIVASAGSWKTGDEWSMSDGAGAGLATEIKEMREQQAKEKELGYKECQQRTIKILAKLPLLKESHAYFVNKKLRHDALTNVWLDNNGDLLIGMYNAAVGHELCGFQRITADGEKRFQRGVKLGGSYHTLKGTDGNAVIFCEGYATGLSIYEALYRSYHVVVCFTSGNLLTVAKDLSPHIKGKIFIAADNDQWTKVRNKPHNAGLLAATEASAAIGAGLLIPHGLPDGKTDWDDYRQVHGESGLRGELIYQVERGPDASKPPAGGEGYKEFVEALEEKAFSEGAFYNGREIATAVSSPLSAETMKSALEQLKTPTPVAMTESFIKQTVAADTIIRPAPQFVSGDSWLGALSGISVDPIVFEVTPKGKVIMPTQDQVATLLADYYGAHLRREGSDVFLWRTTHWEELPPKDFKRFIRVQGQYLMNGEARDRELDAYYNLFIDKLDQVRPGQSFYLQAPNVCNFLDGTLWVEGRGRECSIRFREHNRDDLITWAIPMRYGDPRPANSAFNDWIDRTFQGDADAAGKIKALRMIGGACLAPMFPCIGFFHGPAGTGKSTFAKLCMQFIGQGNSSSLPPEEMQGFMLETMINKRVNIVTDIAGGRVDKGIFKRFADKTDMTINRKMRTGVRARLPFLHIFCGNDLPQGMDSISTAMDRRICIIEIKNQLSIKDMEQDIDQRIFESGAGAILDFFEQGLRELVASGGFYYMPESGKTILGKYKLNNPVRAFLDEISKNGIEHNDRKILVRNGAKIRKQIFFDCFSRFSSHSGYSRQRFNKEMEELGYFDGHDRDGSYWSGFEIGNLVMRVTDNGPGF